MDATAREVVARRYLAYYHPTTAQRAPRKGLIAESGLPVRLRLPLLTMSRYNDEPQGEVFSGQRTKQAEEATGETRGIGSHQRPQFSGLTSGWPSHFQRTGLRYGKDCPP